MATADLRQRLGRMDSRIWIALAVNLVLVIAYLWSRGGQTITVRMEARGDEVAVYVDGREFARGVAPGTSGGPIIRLAGSDAAWLPGLADPEGVRAVDVTDLDNGEVLYRWHSGDDIPESSSVILQPVIDLSGQPWKDYAVTVKFANPTGGGVSVRAGTGAAPTFGFERSALPAIFLQYTDADGEQQTIGTNRLEFDSSEGTRGLVAAVLAPYPWILLAFGALCGIAMLAGRLLRLPASASELEVPGYAFTYAAWTLAVLAFVTTSFILSRYGQRMPHIIDETSYIFQAKVLASGRAHVAPPPIEQAFAFSAEPFLFDYGGRFASLYPFGHPLVLAVGELFGVMWLIPALVGASCIALIFVLTRRLYSPLVALLAALLMVTSPFFLMQASTFMSHNTAVMFLLAALSALLVPARHRVPLALFAGVCFGLFFNTRPFTAVALAPWFALLAVAPLVDASDRRENLARAAAFVAGGLLMLGAYYAYNHATTGSFNNGYQEGGDLGAALGLNDGHNLELGLENHRALLGTLIAVLDGWPAYIALAFVLVPFILGTRRWFDWWMLGASITVMAVQILYHRKGIAHGPRYWYEITPFLYILSARGAIMAGERAAALAGAIRGGFSARGARTARLVTGTIVIAVVFALCAWSVYAWLFAQEKQWQYFATPAQPSMMRFGFDDRLTRAVEAADVDDALVLVAPCGDAHLCYQSVFWKNSPDFDGDIVYANDLGDRNPELFAFYPCRNLYYATYDPPVVRAAGQTPPAPGEQCP